MSGLGNREVSPGVIHDWKIMVEMICGKVCFEYGVKETRGDRWLCSLSQESATGFVTRNKSLSNIVSQQKFATKV